MIMTASRKLPQLFAAAFTVAALGVGAGRAHAATVGFDVFYNPSGADTTGLNIVLDVTKVGDNFVFDFSNQSNDGSSIINFYFEAGLRGHYLMYGHGTRAGESSDGVNIERGATPRVLPGGDSIGWITNTFSFGAQGMGQNQIVNGLNDATEALTVTVLGSDMSLDDLLTTLVTGRTRIAIGVIGANGESIALTTNASIPTGDEEDEDEDGGNDPVTIPTPGAALSGLALLGLMSFRRRRQD
jgi:hypothetical protein